MEIVKEQATNGHLTAIPLTPQEALEQVLKLVDTLGYSLGVVALTPKTRTPIPIIEYLPDGVELQIVMVKRSGPDEVARRGQGPNNNPQGGQET